MNHISRTIISALILLHASLFTSLVASPERGDISSDVLRREVIKRVQKNADQLPESMDQVVTVGFLINAKQELIILDVNGDSDLACAYVKQILNYGKLKYTQARQLTRYSITIHLVGRKN